MDRAQVVPGSTGFSMSDKYIYEELGPSRWRKLKVPRIHFLSARFFVLVYFGKSAARFVAYYDLSSLIGGTDLRGDNA
jgi:hypothetical protein